MTEAKTSLKRTLVGKVVSDKRAKTVTVLVERRVKHALYGKIVIKSSKYHAHDEQGEFHTGDVVEITESKPISQKPAEVRMGNGKGNPEYYVAEIQPGKIVFEIVGVPEELAREAFKLAAAKLPLRTTFVTRQLGT